MGFFKNLLSPRKSKKSHEVEGTRPSPAGDAGAGEAHDGVDDPRGGHEADRQQHPVALSDFEVFRVLGVGSFGRVHLVKHKGPDSSFYAIKKMKKTEIIRQKQVEHTNNECAILLKTSRAAPLEGNERNGTFFSCPMRGGLPGRPLFVHCDGVCAGRGAVLPPPARQVPALLRGHLLRGRGAAGPGVPARTGHRVPGPEARELGHLRGGPHQDN